MCSFDMNIQADELFAAEYEDWNSEMEASQPQQIEIIGVYPISNCGGYQVGSDEIGDLFYRLIAGEFDTEWEPLDTLENPEDDYRERAYNPDQQAFLFPMDDVLRVA